MVMDRGENAPHALGGFPPEAAVAWPGGRARPSGTKRSRPGAGQPDWRLERIGRRYDWRTPQHFRSFNVAWVCRGLKFGHISLWECDSAG